MQTALTNLSHNDAVLADLISRYRLPLPKSHTDYYHELASSIISQQLSVKAALTIETRVKDLFNGRLPLPDELLATDVSTLRSAGLSRGKVSYLQDLARGIIDGSVSFDTIKEMTNDEVVSLLTQIKGIGPWTAHMFLIFCMARLDVLPSGDLGIQNAIHALYLPDKKVTPGDVVAIANRYNWHPYESIASLYLWKSLDNLPE